MKRILAIMLALMLCALGALAEEADAGSAPEINTLIEEGSFIIQIPVDEGDEGWQADDMSQDDTVVKLYDADVLEDTFVARYDPVGDGDMTVSVRHYYNGFACDKAMTWDLRVADGAVQEVIGGSVTESPAEADLDSVISGEWIEKENGLSQLTVTKNADGGWDVEVYSPVSQGVYILMANACYDCVQDAFLYDKGKFFQTPVTDSEDAELGEPVVVGATGQFTLESEDELTLRWYNDQSPEEDLLFIRMDEDDPDDVDSDVDTSDWSYYTFEGSAVAMKLPADFHDNGQPPAEGVFYNAGDDDVVLQVIPTDDDFSDRDALMEFYNTQEYIVRATQLEINGVELVYAEGADDGAMVYAAISPEGTTYQFVFLPQSDRGEAVIEAITSTICSSESIPE